jgi:hypothetical protein
MTYKINVRIYHYRECILQHYQLSNCRVANTDTVITRFKYLEQKIRHNRAIQYYTKISSYYETSDANFASGLHTM